MTSQREQVRSLFGAWAVISVIQVFLAELVVSRSWAGEQSYSPIFNVISDLGAAHCGIHSARFVCSPLNWLMNASLALQGLGMILGGLLLSSTLLGVAAGVRSSRAAHARLAHSPAAQLKAAAWARWLLVAAGAGVILLAVFPEDTISALHFTGALTFFGAGTIALLLLWWIWYQRSALSWVLLVLGVVSAVATVAFAIFSVFLQIPGFPDGLVERLIVYPLIIGLSLVGIRVARGVRQQRLAERARLAG
ncbi:DUF998 domain-containing protein [Psychromicrobium sp. YIM B11713]|uniref:DUF998 domain-containing protein n=1 Tax=Psychromicrobium sp. YIM B11713 TaxID=3145233 RepID=UPI00374F159E